MNSTIYDTDYLDFSELQNKSIHLINSDTNIFTIPLSIDSKKIKLSKNILDLFEIKEQVDIILIYKKIPIKLTGMFKTNLFGKKELKLNKTFTREFKRDSIRVSTQIKCTLNGTSNMILNISKGGALIKCDEKHFKTIENLQNGNILFKLNNMLIDLNYVKIKTYTENCLLRVQFLEDGRNNHLLEVINNYCTDLEEELYKEVKSVNER